MFLRRVYNIIYDIIFSHVFCEQLIAIFRMLMYVTTVHFKELVSSNHTCKENVAVKPMTRSAISNYNEDTFKNIFRTVYKENDKDKRNKQIKLNEYTRK